MDLLEEIRTLLTEAQVDTVEIPWNYTDADLYLQIRSAFRYLRAIGYTLLGAPFDPMVDELGVLTGTLTEQDGMLTAYYVASKLVSGDIMQRLMAGELGISYKSGPDEISTTGAARGFQMAASGLGDTFSILLTIALTAGVSDQDSIYGDQTVYEA
jgi:hypothetical protein